MAVLLPVLDYTQRDPDQILNTLKNALVAFTNGAWTDFTENDLGYAFLKAAVALYDMNAFFCDQQVAETMLSLAMMRESVIRRAKELGYVPGQASPATVSVLLSFPSFDTGFTIPVNSSWVINSLTFQNLDPIVIAPNTTSTQVLLTQGSPYNSSTTASGVPWAKLVMPVNAANIQVSVNNTVWTAVDTFIEVPQANSYKVYEDVGGQTVEFGVPLNGLNTPQAGDTILVTAILTGGASGNIFVSGQNVRPQSVIRDSGGSTVTGAFTGTTLTSALGGADVESTESIRENAPAYYGTQDRAVSEQDVAAIVRAIPGIKSASAIGGQKLGQYGYTFVTVYGQSPYELTGDLQTEVGNVLDQKGMSGMTYVVSGPIVVEAQQTIDIGVSDAVFGDPSLGINSATGVVSSFFSQLAIAQNLRESKESAAIEAIDGIEYSNINTTVDTFAFSTAGAISIPVILNPDLTNAVLKDSSNNVLFSGDATSMVSNGNFLFAVEGLSDQKCTLYYKSTGPDVLVNGKMIVVLTNMTMTAQTVVS
jgi:hypothetical protein